MLLGTEGIAHKPHVLRELRKDLKVGCRAAALSPHLAYFSKRLGIPYVYQVVKKNAVDIIKDNIRIISSGKFLSWLV